MLSRGFGGVGNRLPGRFSTTRQPSAPRNPHQRRSTVTICHIATKNHRPTTPSPLGPSMRTKPGPGRVSPPTWEGSWPSERHFPPRTPRHPTKPTRGPRTTTPGATPAPCPDPTTRLTRLSGLRIAAIFPLVGVGWVKSRRSRRDAEGALDAPHPDQHTHAAETAQPPELVRGNHVHSSSAYPCPSSRTTCTRLRRTRSRPREPRALGRGVPRALSAACPLGLGNGQPVAATNLPADYSWSWRGGEQSGVVGILTRLGGGLSF